MIATQVLVRVRYWSCAYANAYWRRPVEADAPCLTTIDSIAWMCTFKQTNKRSCNFEVFRQQKVKEARQQRDI